MTVRALDSNGDWVWGLGLGSYLSGLPMIRQQIQCAILSFLGDCFFDINAGIDWFNLLGSRGNGSQIALQLAIRGKILNISGVTGTQQPSIVVNSTSRGFSGSYNVQTIYGQVSGTFQYDVAG